MPLPSFRQGLAVLAVLAATPLLAQPLSAAPAAVPAPGPSRQMEHINVVQIGTRGSPVILIPGLSSPRQAWDGVAPELARNHRVYLVQVNGFGGEDPRGNLQPGLLEHIVADLDRLIAAERLEAPALVGHSMGGLVAMMLAARFPDRVGRLMIVDALPFFSVMMAPPGTEVTVAMVEPRARQMRDAVAAGYGKPADPAAAEANVAGMTLKPEMRVRLKDWAMAADPRVSALALYEDLTTDMRPELAAIKAPVTIVYAWNDTYPRQDRADAFFRGQFAGLPSATFVGIGESAHFVMFDQPDQFRAALADFLAPTEPR